VSGAGITGALLLPGPSPLHRLAPQVKLVAALGLAIAIVSTPRTAVWAFAVHACLLAAAARAGRVPLSTLVRRLWLGAPVVLVALLLPLVAEGERVAVVGGLTVSEPGLWAAWNVAAKGLLGLATTLVLVSTTALADLVRGAERLRVPAVFCTIALFMLRYVEVVVDELSRMRIARISRADDPRWLWQARSVASTAGATFVRSFERGERVHLAMVSRGFDGTLTGTRGRSASHREWVAALVPVAAAGVVALLAWSASGAA
jgi:cobalt/nickel transport system permease protein